MKKMAEGDVKKVLSQDLQMVKDLIEYCLQQYMSQKEVIQTLEQNAHIDPAFTELVWQKLEEENREFFKAYNFRLKVKNQISTFNQLLQKQVELMHSVCSSSETSSSPCYAPESLVNGGRVDLLPAMNGSGVKMEPNFSCASEFMFHANDDFCQELSALGDPGLSPFVGSELDVPQLNGFGGLGFPDLAADFTQGADLMEGFCGGPIFPSLEFNGVSGLSGRKCEGEDGALDAVSGVRNDSFRGD